MLYNKNQIQRKSIDFRAFQFSQIEIFLSMSFLIKERKNAI